MKGFLWVVFVVVVVALWWPHDHLFPSWFVSLPILLHQMVFAYHMKSILPCVGIWGGYSLVLELFDLLAMEVMLSSWALGCLERESPWMYKWRPPKVSPAYILYCTLWFQVYTENLAEHPYKFLELECYFSCNCNQFLLIEGSRLLPTCKKLGLDD